jgi:hypothetical protein
MAGATKKAEHTVESFKSEKGDRTPIESTSAEGLPSSPARLQPRWAFLILCAVPAPRSRATVA